MQLLIIDVQNTYIKHIPLSLLKKVPVFAKSFSEVFYLFDNINDQSFEEEFPNLWEKKKTFRNSIKVLTKNYAFFRSFMDAGLDEDSLVRFIKFMIKYKVNDSRDILENEEVLQRFFEDFKKGSDLHSLLEEESIYFPQDLADDFLQSLKSGVTLVGGARTECLMEVSILLKALDIPHQIHEELTY